MNKEDQKFFDNLLDTDWVGSADDLWELLTGILLDTRTPLERMAIVTRRLKALDWLDYRKLRDISHRWGVQGVANILREAGYPWYNQKAKLFDQDIEFDLSTATFEQMQTVRGIGPKLASLWMRIVHNQDLPVIDVHVKRWLGNQGVFANKYEVLAEALKHEAEQRGLTVAALDRLIVENGIRKRRGMPLKSIPERLP